MKIYVLASVLVCSTAVKTSDEDTLTRHQHAGADWTQEDLLWTRAELYKMFGWAMRPGYKSHSNPNAAKALRLAFHDCEHYTDGTGGCDGCINYEGMDGTTRKYPPFNENRAEDDAGAGDNNGLHDLVVALQEIYEAPMQHTGQSLKEGSKSRADLWAFAGIVAVEFGIEANNRVCDGLPLTSLKDGSKVPSCFEKENDATCDPVTTYLDNVQCPQRKLSDSEQANSCKIEPPSWRPRIQFQTGRIDCENAGVPIAAGGKPWNTTKPESHPLASMNGPQVLEFLRLNFSLNSWESVALMGAHAMGKYNKRQTMFKYTWTPYEEHILNNQYYRHLSGSKDWHIDDNLCTEVGTAYKQRPHGKYMAKMNRMTRNGGPIQWVQYKHVCPNCVSLENQLNAATNGPLSDWSEDKKAEARRCCQGFPTATHGCLPDNNRSSDSDSLEGDDDPYGGCEQWRIIRGRESTLLNSDMGLYLQFEVNSTDGKPMGCHGLENFTTEKLNSPMKGAWQSHIGYTEDGDPKWGQECPLQDYAPDGKKLYKIVEKYASNEMRWITDFFKVMTKMLANGYPGNLSGGDTSSALKDAPDHWAIDAVTCSWPMIVNGGVKQRQVTCTDGREQPALSATSTLTSR